ncbi:MAG TPA: amidohydrolase family protein [Thermoanaerobaculia bacterium]
MRTPLRLLLFLTLAASLARAEGDSGGIPPIPDSVPSDAVRYSVLSSGNPAGNQLVWKSADGRRHALYQYNDRGRGPRIDTVTMLGTDEIPTSTENTGNDYLKGPVEERFSIRDGVARWKNKAENGERPVKGAAFFPSFYGPPDEFGLLAKALLRAGGSMPLLPEGEARIEKVRDVTLARDGESRPVTLYAVRGFQFSPSYVWLDRENDLFASGSRWLMTIRAGWEKSQEELARAQDEASIQWRGGLAQRISRKPATDVVFHNVNVFDAETGKLLRNRVITLHGNRIASVGSSDTGAGGAERIDGGGGTLLPGLWDMHVHVSDDDGLLNIAAGVTSVRDLANDTDELEARRKRYDAGIEIGPRVIAAGFMDGPGPYQGPTKVLVETEQKVHDAIARYAALGYPQIKVYSSIKPELVPVIIADAHKRGMRVSGHVPATMFADQFVRAGADELQHINFVFLNFFRDVTETRTPARFIEPGKRGAGLDLDSAAVKDFIELLKSRHVVVDPTLATFESMYRARPGTLDPAFAAVANRMPTQLRRSFLAGGLPAEGATDDLYRRSYANMVKMVGLLHRSGVQIVAGTDTLPGFGLHRELELYREAGLPASEILQIATLRAAKLMKRDGELGSIQPGKLADLVLVAGDPTQDISTVRNTKLVVKDGVVFDPSRIYEAIGVQPK